MAVSNIRFRLNRRGVAELLTSVEVVADVQRRAQAVASAANSIVEGHDVLDTTSNRARATVMARGAAAESEATNHTLTAALNAARR